MRFYSLLLTFTLLSSFLEAAPKNISSQRDSSGQTLEAAINKFYAPYIRIESSIGRVAVKSSSNVRFYALSGARMNGPHSLALNDADKLNHVDLHAVASIKCKAYRYYDRNKGKTWSEWKRGTPAELQWLTTSARRKNNKFTFTKATGLQYLTYWKK
ncbi:hypothetical protein [Rubritalea profundi]|uniref:Uncharacterized protein n=1 Tax=Rubritalea profundi TaxID=1658618 RepID=A0A2S7U5Q7_9BACT|nr:hypothetical protein [Rubritalea profundi]PQJ29662.1 hypothetical protein BSZ32_14970 [Rubritalea profundi]